MPWTAARVGMRATRTPSVAGLLGGGGRGVAQLGVVGQQHHLAGVRAADGVDQLAAGGRLAGAGDHGGGAGLGAQPGEAVAGDHGDDGALGGFGLDADVVAALGGEVGDPDPVRPPGLDARLHGGPASSTWTWTFHSPSPPTTTRESPSASSRVAQPVHRSSRGLQQVDHLEGGPAVVEVLGAVERALAERAARRTGRRRQPRHGSAVHRGRGLPGPGTRRPYRSLPGHRLHQRPQDRHQAASAGVHDARPAEDGELLRGRRPGRRAPPRTRRAPPRASSPLLALRGFGGRRGDGQHGALDRVGDGLPGGARRPGQREAQVSRVDRRRPAPRPYRAATGPGSCRSSRGRRSARRAPWRVRRRRGGCGGAGLMRRRRPPRRPRRRTRRSDRDWCRCPRRRRDRR